MFNYYNIFICTFIFYFVYRVLSFAEFPMGSLHEGIFFSQTQAEAYMNIFTPQTNHADVQNVKHVSCTAMKYKYSHTIFL